MTTSELKSYIDRILGNNIRLLLPSYWWKRAFGAVIDKVDEKVEKSELKTINGESVLGEGDLRVGVKSVESVEKLEKLEAHVGDIASVLGKTESATVKIADCYMSSYFEKDWDKYTIIKGVEEKPDALQKDDCSILLIASKYSSTSDSYVVCIEGGNFYYIRFLNDEASVSSLKKVNDGIASGNYRLVSKTNEGDIDQYFTFYSKVAEDTADAYIKGETWTRLLKEGDVTGGGSEIREFYTGDSLTDEQKAWNLETATMVEENKCTTIFKVTAPLAILPVGTTIPLSAFVDRTFLYVFSSGVNAAFVSITIDSNGNSDITAETVSADATMSSTSTNAVQNKVVTAALNNKVDKVNGKQLSTEDFTSALKAKLEGLSNYDDTEIENAVSSLQTQLNTLVSGNASDAINSFNEIIAFLNGVKDSESLDSIIASIEQQIASKQDKITDLDTIRANAAKGATALQSVPSEYITESELNAKNFATTSQVNAKQDSISDLDTIRSNASLGATAIQKVKTINGESITGDGNVEIFTKAMHDELVENMLENEEVYAAAVNDLNTRLVETNATIATEVSTRESLSNDVQSLTDRITSNEEVTATSYNELNDRIEANYQHGEETYATITSLAEEVAAITTTIVENEEVVAATLNDLLTRIDALTTRIEILENA